ncbi:hypothetical protein CA54_47470 [Symmachiella macrocystis]|uniref:Uncharacterized protein n=1 Tax=Symmachiella macrocystis TaxID=2527985 RepID=A0A5C6BB94_9PLAN|nr:hypothetical protein [Symmachiella macrocystis]TWU09505.1 hypothetical protein CA54_47470 [Symmachiella macrocystis]
MTKTLPILCVAATLIAAMAYGYAAPPELHRAILPDLPAGPQNQQLPADLTLAQAETEPEETAEKPAETPAEKPPEKVGNKATAADALRKSRELLSQHQSIRANVIETVEIGTHGFTATGRYLQRGKMKLRLEFDLQIGQTIGAMMEVCDGEVLHTRHIIGEEVQLTRRNVREILEAASSSKVATADMFIAEMGFGGLPGLLAAMEQSMTFDNLKDDSLGDKSVWMIQGTWNQQFRSRFLPPQQANAGPQNGQQAAQQLPSLVPDFVKVFLDRQTGFPLKIQYLKKVAGRNHARPMLTLAFRDIELNGAIDDSEFTFIPPETPTPVDLTALYKERIRAAEQAAAQQNNPGAPQTGQPPQN